MNGGLFTSQNINVKTSIFVFEVGSEHKGNTFFYDFKNDGYKYSKRKMEDLGEWIEIKKKLDTKQWKEYKLGDLFESSTGDFDIQKKHIDDVGKLIVSSGLTNSGIIGKTSINSKIFNQNTLTVDMFGNTFFRGHKYKMVTHGRVFSLKTIKESPKNSILFISIILNKILPAIFNYNNMCSWNKINDLFIKLPSKLNTETNKYEPNWQYMEDYITNLENELKQEL